MEKTNIYKYYVFGYNYCVLRLPLDDTDTCKRTYERIVNFTRELTALELPVTISIASDLNSIAADFKASGSKKTSDAQHARLQECIDRFDPALDAELKLKDAYILTKKRYPLETLLQDPLSLLAPGCQYTLCETALKDYKMACHQIALDSATAAAFHLMRALEAQVKVLYFAFKKTKRLERPMWGNMTQQLAAKRPPKPSEKLLDLLDGMRVHFRNPTQHPEVFYDIDQAQDLLSQTIVAVNLIASELPKPKPALVAQDEAL